MNRRQEVLLILTILIASANLYNAETSAQNSLEGSSICFERYVERSTNATEEYAKNHIGCHDLRKIKHAAFTREKEPEREQIENGTAQICENLRSCNAYDAHEDFYNCHVGKSTDNMDIMITIHLNASAALIELSSQYEEAEKEVMLCLIEAQRIYAKETTDSLNELRKCLKG